MFFHVAERFAGMAGAIRLALARERDTAAADTHLRRENRTYRNPHRRSQRTVPTETNRGQHIQGLDALPELIGIIRGDTLYLTAISVMF